MPSPTDLGLAEFISALVGESMDAIASSLVEQELRRSEMSVAVNLDLETFAASYVLDSEVWAREREVLGSPPEGPGLEVDGPAPSKAALKTLGVDLGQADTKGRRLTARGVERVRSGIRASLGASRKAAWAELARQGVPRIVVDEGRILAKLSIEILADADSSAQPVEGPGGRPLRLAGRAASAPSLAAAIPAATKDVRFSVRPAATESAEGGHEADLYGEVEIKFRTVF